MRRHLPNTLHHTDCTRRTTAGRRNRYARAASRIGCGIANAPGAGQMNSSRRRCVTDLSLDGSAPVFSIVWFTRGSIDASAARGRAVPTERLFSRLAKCGVPFGGGRFRRAAVHGGASDFSDRRTAAPIHGSVPHLRRTAIVPAANDHSPTGTGMTGTPPENPVPETMLRPMIPTLRPFRPLPTSPMGAQAVSSRAVVTPMRPPAGRAESAEHSKSQTTLLRTRTGRPPQRRHQAMIGCACPPFFTGSLQTTTRNL